MLIGSVMAGACSDRKVIEVKDKRQMEEMRRAVESEVC